MYNVQFYMFWHMNTCTKPPYYQDHGYIYYSKKLPLRFMILPVVRKILPYNIFSKFLHLTYRFMIHFDSFLYMVQYIVQFHICAYRYSVSPRLFVVRLSLELSLHLCQKPINHLCGALVLKYLSWSISWLWH